MSIDFRPDAQCSHKAGTTVTQQPEPILNTPISPGWAGFTFPQVKAGRVVLPLNSREGHVIINEETGKAREDRRPRSRDCG